MSIAFSNLAFSPSAFSSFAFALEEQVTDFTKPIAVKFATINNPICEGACLSDSGHALLRMSGTTGKSGTFTDVPFRSVGFIGDQGRFVCMGESPGYYVEMSDIVTQSVTMND